MHLILLMLFQASGHVVSQSLIILASVSEPLIYTIKHKFGFPNAHFYVCLNRVIYILTYMDNIFTRITNQYNKYSVLKQMDHPLVSGLQDYSFTFELTSNFFSEKMWFIFPFTQLRSKHIRAQITIIKNIGSKMLWGPSIGSPAPYPWTTMIHLELQ